MIDSAYIATRLIESLRGAFDEENTLTSWQRAGNYTLTKTVAGDTVFVNTAAGRVTVLHGPFCDPSLEIPLKKADSKRVRNAAQLVIEKMKDAAMSGAVTALLNVLG